VSGNCREYWQSVRAPVANTELAETKLAETKLRKTGNTTAGDGKTPKANWFSSALNKIAFWLVAALAALALSSSIGLLSSTAGFGFTSRLSPAISSALPLLAAGASFLLLQAMIRPRRGELLKSILIVTAFLLWGVVQLIEHNPLSKTLGDIVIALYVVELVWTILAALNAKRKGAA
jgi:peptidoglycan/LPS O-acetylase OafA/YrhL